VLVVALLVAGFFVFTRSLAKKEAPREAAKALGADEMPWVDLGEVRGALRAVLWGDPASGAYGAWNKWPPGTNAGTYNQSADARIIVMSGKLVYSFEDGPAKDFSAGSYIYVPGGKVRSLKCDEASEDCIFFNEQPGPFDFNPVTSPAK
jgi:hypothetical protein